MPWTSTEQRAFAEKLRSEQRSKGLTQEALAHAAGLSVRRLAHLESGAGNPRAATLAAIADVLGIETAELLRVSGCASRVLRREIQHRSQHVR